MPSCQAPLAHGPRRCIYLGYPVIGQSGDATEQSTTWIGVTSPRELERPKITYNCGPSSDLFALLSCLRHECGECGGEQDYGTEVAPEGKWNTFFFFLRKWFLVYVVAGILVE